MTARSERAAGGSWQIPFYVHTLLIQAITFVLRPTAIYRAIDLDVPPQYLGAMGACFAIVPLVLAVPSGQAADRFGERRVMLLGSALTLASAVGFLTLGSSVVGLIGCSVLLGTGHLGCVVGQQALVANRTQSHRYDTAFGHYTFAASAGQALGPALIIVFGGSSAIPDTRTIFAFTIALGIMLLGVSALLPAGHPGTTRHAPDQNSMRFLLRRPGLIRALTVSSVVLAAVDISLVYLPVLGTDRDIAAGVVGILLAIRAVASMASRLFLGRLSAWIGRGPLLTASIAMSAAGMALLPVDMPIALLAALVALMGFGLGAGQPLTMSWLAESTPPGLRGRAMSLRLTGNRLGQVLVPTLAGAIAAGGGASGVLWLTSGSLAAVGIASRHISPARPPEDNSQ